ncbi:uncharacterized protein DEA37_0010132 [Paragonimus westermani]|uniref:Uncharacterized protein n=1 Tax=Paragonimus westermani TaxID=34504 RepID=A0A5J4P2I5_9TREM|nr:uncharacterized protein DEA37_0010132 [Paragonimus westermani]
MANVKLKAQCDDLQAQLQTIANELENQRNKYVELQSTHNSRQWEWDSLLKEVNKSAAAQAKELVRTKQLLINKQAELRRLSSEAFSRQSELMASRDVVQRLEAAVTRHLSILSSERTLDDPASSSGTFSCTQPSDNLFSAEFDDKLCKLEQKLSINLDYFVSLLGLLKISSWQQENLALTDLLTGAERFNRTRTPCATELPTEIRTRLPMDMCSSKLNIPSKVVGDGHCLASELGSPQSSARSITIQSPTDCVPKRELGFLDLENQTVPKLFNSAQLGISLCLPSSENNLLPLSSTQSGSKSICGNTSKSCIDRPFSLSVPMPMADTKSIVEAPDHLPVGHASTEYDSGQALHLSGASMSPSEYEDFVMPNSDRLYAGDGCDQCGDSPRVSRLPSDCTPEKASLFDSLMNNRTKSKQPFLRDIPPSPAMNSTELVSTWCHNHRAFPQACSTAHKDTTQPFRLASDDEEEDTNVYCLAAKFLANEQEHSLRLETQIDIHLEELRRQLEHSSSTT